MLTTDSRGPSNPTEATILQSLISNLHDLKNDFSQLSYEISKSVEKLSHNPINDTKTAIDGSIRIKGDIIEGGGVLSHVDTLNSIISNLYNTRSDLNNIKEALNKIV